MFPNNMAVSNACIDFLEKLLTLCPERRMSAAQALQHPYLVTEEPLACEPSELPRFECEMSQKFAKKQNNMIKTQATNDQRKTQLL